MQIILIRHGLKQKNQVTDTDSDKPLSNKGRNDVEQLITILEDRNLLPSVFFTSCYQHAIETANILQNRLGGELERIPSLTPDPDRKINNFRQIIKEAKERRKDLKDLEVVAFVGHNPWLSDLLNYLIPNSVRTLDRAEAVCVSGTAQDLFQGRGKIDFLTSDLENQDEHTEEQLRSKIKSKMTVSTFLAGFTFSVLNELLKIQSFTLLPTVAVVSLTGALALFIASVYMYDQMSMPKRYWRDQSNTISHPVELLYYFMLRTWNWIFTPAVILALIGFIATLFNTKNYQMAISGVLIIVVVIIYYFIMKPRLGSD